MAKRKQQLLDSEFENLLNFIGRERVDSPMEHPILLRKDLISLHRSKSSHFLRMRVQGIRNGIRIPLIPLLKSKIPRDAKLCEFKIDRMDGKYIVTLTIESSEVEYECKNCKYKWTEEYKKGDTIQADRERYYLHSHEFINECDFIISRDSFVCATCRRMIRCPLCNEDEITLLSNVYIIPFSPALEEAEERKYEKVDTSLVDYECRRVRARQRSDVLKFRKTLGKMMRYRKKKRKRIRD